MPAVTIKNIPAALHRALRTRAKANRRSLNSEVLATLEGCLTRPVRGADAILAESAAFRARLNLVARPADVTRFKREGRP